MMFEGLPTPLPVYHDPPPPPTFNHNRPPPLLTTTTQSSPYRPTISSPLSSSPLRAAAGGAMTASSPPPPLSPRDANARLQRDTQSSPVAPKFAFAARPSRPNPVAQKREAAQESRRRLFLKNVRQRAEDRRWEARGGEQELLKLEWQSLNKDLRQAKDADLDGLTFDSDIEEAVRLRQEVMRRPPILGTIPEEGTATNSNSNGEADCDEMMLDMLEQEEQAEMEKAERALSAMAPPRDDGRMGNGRPPDSPPWSDDAEYDALFMEYLSQESVHSGAMDLS